MDDFPEVVHLELTSRCQFDCDYCYSRTAGKKDLTTDQWKSILINLAGSGIFQVTFGGGEPTLRKDLGDLAKFVRDFGIKLCMTTNGMLLRESSPGTLVLFDQISVSYHGDRYTVEDAIDYVATCSHGTSRGVNFIALKRYMDGNTRGFLMYMAEHFGAELIILTGKGIHDALPPDEVMAFAKSLSDDGATVLADGLTCSVEREDYCMQKIRFCDVDPQGNVFPCSFIREPIGNLTEKPLVEIWANRGPQLKCPFVKENK